MTAGINTLKTGLTTRGNGQEQYEIIITNYNGRKITTIEYTYYHNNGQKYNISRATLQQCRAECERRIMGIQANRALNQTKARLATV